MAIDLFGIYNHTTKNRKRSITKQSTLLAYLV